MNRYPVFFCLICLAALPIYQPVSLAAVDPPLEIAEFRLGSNISEYSDIDHADYLQEIEVADWYGFRRGYISYGTCAYPDTVVKIRMKYEDSSKKFYDELLKKFKEKFGPPDEWKGDAFGVVHTWKWTFFDEQDRRINLVLQHNLQNPNENIGNIVKLSLPDREEEERLCFLKLCEANKDAEARERMEKRKLPQWDYMIPR